MAEKWSQAGRVTDLAPGMLELARIGGQYERLMQICRERGDVVGFTAARGLDAQGHAFAEIHVALVKVEVVLTAQQFGKRYGFVGVRSKHRRASVG